MKNNFLMVGLGHRFKRSLAFAMIFFIILTTIPGSVFADEPTTDSQSVDTTTTTTDVSTPPTTDTNTNVTTDTNTTTTDTSTNQNPTIETPENPNTDQNIEQTPETNLNSNTTESETTESENSAPADYTIDSIRNKTQDVQNTLHVSPDSVTGALTYTYPLAVPPGRNQITTPDLRLIYNSQDGDDMSTYGYGWSDSIPYIERMNKRGTDNMYNDTYFRSSISGELASTSATTYIPKYGDTNFISYTFSDNKWIAYDKAGTKYTFGTTTNGILNNPDNTSNIYRWMLEEIRDTNDNYIKYTYFKESNYIYISNITYTGHGSTDGNLTIDFSYSTKSVTNNSGKSGFLMTGKYTTSNIVMKVNSVAVHRYDFVYTNGESHSRTLLQSITETGYDENSVSTALPSTTFNYSTSTPGYTENTNLSPANGYPFVSNFSTDNDFVGGQDSLLSDVNGDGLPDFIQSYSDTGSGHHSETKLNTGNGYVASSTWNVNSDLIFRDYQNNNHPTGLTLADINGDGLPDIVPMYTPDGAIYLNTGHGFATISNWSMPTGTVFLDVNSYPKDQGRRLADINGDGLLDVVQAYFENTSSGGQSIRHVWINTGSSFVESTSWTLPLDFVSFPNGTSQGEYDLGVRLSDINNDGLVDIVKAYDANVSISAATPDIEVFINTGSGYNTTSYGSPTLLFAKAVQTSPYTYQHADLGTRFVDINNDQFPDLLQNLQGSTVWAKIRDNTYTQMTGWNSPAHFADESGVNFNYYDKGTQFGDLNGDGFTDIIQSYVHAYVSSDYHAYLNNSTQPTDLLKTVTLSTGGKINVAYQATPTYQASGITLNPHLPYVLQTVKTIATSDGLGTIGTSTYSYSGGTYYYGGPMDRKIAGFASTTETDAVGNVTKTYYHTSNGTDAAHGEYQDNPTKIGRAYRVEKYDAAGNLYERIINKWDSFDRGYGASYAKLAQTIDSAFDGTTSHKDKAVQYAYNDNNGNLTYKKLLGEVSANDDATTTDSGTDDFTTYIVYATSTSGIITMPEDEIIVDHSGNKVKETKHYFDTLSYGSVGAGNETKTEFWVATSTYINTQKTYNSYGLVTQTTDPRSKSTTYTYDTYNLYPTTVTNPLSQATSYLYNYGTGKVKQVTDPNSFVTQVIYDGLGRVLEEKQPDYTTPTTLVTKATYSYTDSSLPSVVHKTNYLDSSATTHSYSYADGLGRTIQTRNSAEASNTYIVQDSVYNKLGMLASSTLPYFATGSSNAAKSSTWSLYTDYYYDALGRVSATANVVGTTTTAYNNWKTTITDPRGKAKDLYNDAYDNLIKVDEHNNGSTYTTNYTYNGLGNLTNITDANSNVRNFTYDGLGRRLTAQDLHDSSDFSFGAYTYTYDNAGNIVSVKDPNLQFTSRTITYTYDDLNRPLTQTYFGNVYRRFTYDTCTNGVGKLCEAMTNGSDITYQYDPLGNKKQETNNLWYNFNYVDYTNQYEYDRQGNITRITYPDLAQVKYTYNAAGLVDKVERKGSGDSSFTDIASAIDYSPINQVSYQLNANGTETSNNYDLYHLYRIINKEVQNNDGFVQDIGYAYDANNNITKIIDASLSDNAKTVDYTYDDLNRLLTASSTYATNGQDFRRVYAYDKIGNITSTSNQGTYGYTTNDYLNPHAVYSIASTTYTYDKNGNLTGSNAGLVNEWNINNQLTYSTDGTHTSTYAYDANGNRVKYSDNTSDTIYPNEYFSKLASGTSTESIYANNQLVATVEVKGATTSIYYVHNDHLSGSNAITDASGTIVENMDYYPFGDMRLDQKTTTFNETKKFTGKDFDPATGYNYFGARYYDSNHGKFISQDPYFVSTKFDLTDPQSMNSYSYARNNPLIYVDPDGNSWVSAFGMSLLGYGTGVTQFAFNSYINTAFPIYGAMQTSQSTISSFSGAYSYTKSFISNPAGTIDSTGKGFGVEANEFLNQTPYDQAKEVGKIAAATVSSVYSGGKLNSLNQSVNPVEEIEKTLQLPSYADANKLNHIFGNPEHNLEGLVKAYGSQEKAFIAIHQATEEAIAKQGITGIFNDLRVNVGSQNVIVRGNVANSTVKIGTAFISK